MSPLPRTDLAEKSIPYRHCLGLGQVSFRLLVVSADDPLEGVLRTKSRPSHEEQFAVCL